MTCYIVRIFNFVCCRIGEKEGSMKKYFMMMMMMFSLALFTQMNNVFANEEFIAEQRDDFDTISPEDALKIRHDIEAMATRVIPPKNNAFQK